MAGKEERGAGAADPNLFHARTYVLTPSAPESQATREFRSWLQKLGANLIDMDPDEHDFVVAYTSHLPQLLSTALAATLERQTDVRISVVFGSGLLGMTRLALSPLDIWRSIFATNKEPVAHAVQDFIHTLMELKANLETGDPVSFFQAAGKFASRIRPGSSE